MITTKLKFLSVMLVAVMLSGCVTGGPKQQGGTLIGAAAGGLLGAQVGKGDGRLVGVALGTLAGAMIGSSVGESLDRADQAYYDRAVYQASSAPVGRTIEWENPDSGNYGTVTPTRDGRDRQTGAYCREYQTTINVGGREQYAYGTACRQPDGSWQVVDSRH